MGIPSEAATSGPAASASSQPCRANTAAVSRNTTMTGAHNLSQDAPAKLPRSQNNTDCAAWESLVRSTRKLAIADRADAVTVPVRTNRSGVIPPCSVAMVKTRIAAPNAPIIAPKLSAHTPAPANSPVVMTAVAPTLAPDDTPSRWGSARALRTRVCTTAPATARPAPTARPSSTRGALIPHTIASSERVTGGPPKRECTTSTTVDTGSISDPNANAHTAESTVTTSRAGSTIPGLSRPRGAPAFGEGRWVGGDRAPPTAFMV